MKLLHSLYSILAIGLVTTAANAAVLFSNGSDSTMNGGYCSSCAADWRVFDSFTLTTSATLTGVRFNAAISAASTNVNTSIWSAPNSGLIYSQDNTLSQLGTNNIIGNFVNNELNAALPNWTLAAGTYWISFYGTDLAIPHSLHIDNSAVQFDNYGNQYSRAFDAPFTLTGNAGNSVPEPTSLAIVGLGLAGLGAARRSKAK